MTTTYKFKPGDIIYGYTHRGDWLVRDILITTFTRKYLYSGEETVLDGVNAEYELVDAGTGLLVERVRAVDIHQYWKAIPKLTALVLYGKTAGA